MLRAKARERAAKGLFLGEGILDNPHLAVLVNPYFILREGVTTRARGLGTIEVLGIPIYRPRR